MDSFEAVLTEALRRTRAAQLPQHLESVAFAKAIEMLSAGIPASRVADSPQRQGAGQSANNDHIERLALKLGIDASVVNELFHYENDSLSLSVAPGKLKTEKSAATRDLAILVAGCRQLADIEEWTQSSLIRNVCDDYGKFDSANFAATLTGMIDVFGFKGKGKNREVRINRIGIQEFKRLILGLAGIKDE